MRTCLNFNKSKKNAERATGLRKVLAGVFLAALAVGGVARADEGPVIDLAPFMVFGSPEGVTFSPGAGYRVDLLEIEAQRYDNIEQVMRRVPGVYFRTEDGYGLFPNISFRGVGSMRTTKLTVMEDGILSAPATYAAPAAYYTPTTGRMSAIEILKGSSQVSYGPHTTGGVLNYVSTAIPEQSAGRIAFTIGENEEMRAHAWYGDVFDVAAGQVGLLFEHYYRSTNGFKNIDTTPGYPGDSTGFTKHEPMLKISFVPARGPRQIFEFKVGYTELEADETYLGLSTDDFLAAPTRRYVSTQFDTITTEQWRAYLRHVLELGAETSLASTVYYNQFARSWDKLHDVRRQGGGSASLAEALAGSPFYDGGAAIPGTEGEPLAVLRGEATGIWRVRDNHRAYKSYGVESVLRHRLDTGALEHNLELGLRLHEDYEDRFQKQDDYSVTAGGEVTSVVRRQRGTQENRRGTARALAVHAKDRIEWDAFTLVPGLRYERVRYIDDRRGMNPAQLDFSQVIQSRKGTLDVWAPGIGGIYALGNNWNVFGGVHRGFSLPPPSGAAAATPLGPERSTGYEAGVRYNQNGALRGEAVLFWTDFSNLIVPDSIGGAGTVTTENAGDVRSRGLELAVAFDPGLLYGWGFRNPYTLAYTWTNATIRSDVSATGIGGGAVESIFAGGRRGNRLPYIPRSQISLGTGIEFGRFGIYLDAFYVSAAYASANHSAEELNPFALSRMENGQRVFEPGPDARFGRISPYRLLDLAAHYEVLPGVALRAGVQNLLDREYMASRLPHGPRPGHPRFFHAGFSWEL